MDRCTSGMFRSAPVRSRRRRRRAAIAVCVVTLFASPTVTQAKGPGDTPASGNASNMGLCSAFLGQLGIRSDVNELLRELGAFLPDGPFDNVGELYRIRAKEKPTAPAAEECLPRDQPPAP